MVAKKTKEPLTTTAVVVQDHHHPPPSPEVGLGEVENRMVVAVSQPGSQPVSMIESKGGDDVSTLGDPYMDDAAPVIGTDNTVGESMISSQQELYVYGVKRSQGMGAVSRMGEDSTTIHSGSYIRNDSAILFKDDTTLEDLYYHHPSPSSHQGTAFNSTPTSESKSHSNNIPINNNNNNFQRLLVHAPSGQLGIVLRNPHGDLPIVSALEETSVLHGRVRAGDLLLSVDGVACQGMSEDEVWTFLSGRSCNPTRILALGRSCSSEVVVVG
mmetsp:Transcript_41961/g.88101  ORF Transcript_41961/g.88101 Transcript_41961/m.88101 type:complete len:270 (+) Transcript_41961:1065-1874(+)